MNKGRIQNEAFMRRCRVSVTNPIPAPNPIMATSDITECWSPNNGVPPPPREAAISEENSLASNSSNSFSEQPLDTEIVNIKNITQALHSGISSKLKHYRRNNHDFSIKHEELNNKALFYQRELETVKGSVNQLLQETSQTHQFIKGLRESFKFKESKVNTENILKCGNCGEINIIDTIKRLKEEVESMKTKIENDQIKYQKSTLATQSNNEYEKMCEFDKAKKQGCGCEVF
ncbi:hypothetical protein SteCoe_12485 [Stentor coeruleus]|uniref:Uncharacterized protein n=1 Tax=Stentor coeruleus TaxID=5963 RepID=A0A1R2CAM1_9CILI|nr:hypothetical protein SteCoe_12485 [Stentor coeruleus]